MPNGKTYTEVLSDVKAELSSLRTIAEYQENHLGNIDSHLNRLNERTNTNERNIDRNTTWRKVIIGVGSPVFLIIIAWLLKLNGVWIGG